MPAWQQDEQQQQHSWTTVGCQVLRGRYPALLPLCCGLNPAQPCSACTSGSLVSRYQVVSVSRGARLTECCCFLQATCSNWDLSRPGPKLFPCPSGHVFLGSKEFYSPPSKEVCCGVSDHADAAASGGSHALQHRSTCTESRTADIVWAWLCACTCRCSIVALHFIWLALVAVACQQRLLFKLLCLDSVWLLFPLMLRRHCLAHALMPTVLKTGHSPTPAQLGVCWTQAARLSQTCQMTCAAW